MKKWTILYLLASLVLIAPFSSEARPKIPALIPLPQSLQWHDDDFIITAKTLITVSHDSLRAQVLNLHKMLQNAGSKATIVTQKKTANQTITIAIDTVLAPYQAAEAYTLHVDKNQVRLRANTLRGVYNGLQTLYQLTDNVGVIKGCDIRDYPAFAWRGYMVDVGRNYQSIRQLKEQIDVMAKYKLNIFHFHLTEHIAWRLQVKQYPQLTAPDSMLRDKGKFYSTEDMHELIRYCKERNITLVPEIDIPGHSEAFTRAMGFDMQSKQGQLAVKNILQEILTEYKFPYLHIGADEVEISDTSFLPAICKLIRQFNCEVIGWYPGGNYSDQTIRQIWGHRPDPGNSKKPIRYLFSRIMYIGDYDPENTVVMLFNRKFREDHGDSILLGTEICNWNDRRLAKEEDFVNMNSVYPTMLAFAERSWRGGGELRPRFSIGEDSSPAATAFTEFEERLLVHKNRYFNKLRFDYVKQTHIKWNLYGPFPNNGQTDKIFWPEKAGPSIKDSLPAVSATGGTIWIRHALSPQEAIAWMPSVKDSATCYAYTQFWCNADSVINMWIDFKDLSRSGADATPPKGEWDYFNGKIWVNDVAIAPPAWKNAGLESGKLEVPLVDEGYYYRPPHRVAVKKGWNRILVKAPMGKFDPDGDWQTPAKWMFTAIPVYKSNGNWEAADMRFEP